MSPDARSLPLKRLIALAPNPLRFSVAGPVIVKLAVKAMSRLLASATIARLDVMAKALADPDDVIEPSVSLYQRARMPSSARPALLTFPNGMFSGQRPVLLLSMTLKS